MPVSISGDGAITGLQLESFEDVDVGSGASDGDVLTYDATGDLWVPQGIELAAGIGSNVVQTVKTNTFSASIVVGVASDVEVTGLNVTITPSSATSKILVMGTVNGSNASRSGVVDIYVKRNGTALVFADIDGNRKSIMHRQSAYNNDVDDIAQVVFMYLDSPATTSAVTYSVWLGLPDADLASQTVYLNRGRDDSNDFKSTRTVSSITAIEVAA